MREIGLSDDTGFLVEADFFSFPEEDEGEYGEDCGVPSTERAGLQYADCFVEMAASSARGNTVSPNCRVSVFTDSLAPFVAMPGTLVGVLRRARVLWMDGVAGVAEMEDTR